MPDITINAKEESFFMQIVIKASLNNTDNHKNTIEKLINIHNDKTIDLITDLNLLSKNIEHARYSFTIFEILKPVLPSIKVATEALMECLKHLADEDIINVYMATEIFFDFCKSDPLRVNESMKLILASPAKWYYFISSTIKAGAIIDLEYYVNQAIQLINHIDVEVRKDAILALGKIDYYSNYTLITQSIEGLKQSANNETDDYLLSCVIRSAFALFLSDGSLEDQVGTIIFQALSKGSCQSFCTASEIFGFNTEKISERLLNIFLEQLTYVSPSNINAIDRIDMGICTLLDQKNLKLISFIEKLLLKNQPKDLSILTFDGVVRGLCGKHRAILNQLTIKWLLSGEINFCLAIQEIICSKYEEDIQIETDDNLISGCNDQQLIFLSRKAIGYLFYKPVTVASIIVSLLDYASESATNKLITLLFDPLLISFPGKVQLYLNNIANTKKDTIKNSIQTALTKLEVYLEDIRSIGEIAELLPSEAQREAYDRYINPIYLESFKEAESRSPLLSVISKIPILYGRNYIHRVYYPNGTFTHTRVPLQKFSVEWETPRLDNLEADNLRHMLIVFKMEQLTP